MRVARSHTAVTLPRLGKTQDSRPCVKKRGKEEGGWSSYRREEAAVEPSYEISFYNGIQFAPDAAINPRNIFIVFSEGFGYSGMLLCEVITLVTWTDVITRKWFIGSPRGRYNF